nr:PREDICTED: ubiquitin carboxyl-terminal hydrolase 15 isoform X5 [Latimeria chalumnae]|eukprot:XP_006000774.1 PREDICTED: ubiquitin carboxyl-terminal hydrolase 15 isoform X5 [Latimeria chalumnae]
MAEGGAAELETQRTEIAALLKTPLRRGDTWYPTWQEGIFFTENSKVLFRLEQENHYYRYLVDSRWFKQWKKYVGFDSWDKYQMGEQNVYPGPVDNSGLLKDDDPQSLKEHLIDELDYILVPIEGWNKLISWYALTESQEPIARKVVEQGMFVKHCKVEVYLTELKLCENGNMNNVIIRRFSKADTIDSIEKEMRKLFTIPDEKETRLWNKYMSNTFEPLNKPDSTIQDAGLYQGQCLSNTPPLTEYFLNDKYEEEMNYDNPLGMRGEIARSYAELIKQMWSGRYSYVTPRAFKTQVGRFAPQFSGYQQQDSQELLAFLLDGLHEDLNRIRKKPYIQLKDADGRPDKVVAEEAWENHIKRNDSIIVDIFHGLFKSTLVCPKCFKVSVTFDPFCYLTLPLPMKKERTLEVFLVRMDPLTKPMQYKVIVPKIGNILDLCAALRTLSGISTDRMIVTDIYNHRFHRIFSMDENLSSIMERDDIYVFEVAVNRTEETDQVVIPVYLREKHRQTAYSHHSGSTLFGQPFLITVPRNISEDKLYNHLLLRMCRYVKTCTESEEVEETLHCCKDNNINGNSPNGVHEEGSPSEMETDEQDDESIHDQELFSENENSQSEDSVGGDNSSENGICSDNTCKGQNFLGYKKRLFTFQFNNLGNTDFSYIKDDTRQIRFDDRHLRLDERSYLALDWDPEVKKRYFDDNAAEDFEKHESVEYKPQKKAFVKLKDCIELFTTKEKLGAEDPWYCPNCKQHQQATKKLDLWSLPPVLVVHLKRFSYSRYMRDKLDTLVVFPITDLDMSEFLINPNAGPSRYNLIAVSNHYGGMGGGHYTAFAKNKDDTKWYNFDDSSVSSASEDQIVSKAAYVLFYQRQDTISGTGYFPLDRESKKSASAATGVPLQSDGDCNENENDVENENCMHTN